MELEKEDYHIRVFMGSSYEIGRPKTISQLKSALEEIASDLPADQELKVAEVHLHNGKLSYTLVDGINE